MCIVLSCRTGGRYFCRNYDRERSLTEKVLVSPRHQVLRFLDGTVLEDHLWMAGTGVAPMGHPLFFEAFNEKGLCMAAVSFEGYAGYSDADEGHLVAAHEMILYVLSRCSSVREARELLSDVHVVDRPFSNKIPSYPLHWMVSDGNGSIVVEPLDGRLVIQDDPAEVMTNGPPLRYHLDNLENYMHLTCRSPRNLLPEELRSGLTTRGRGAMGLPGDYSSVSRFIRGCFVKYNTVPETDTELDVERMFHILEAVAIPRGCVELSNGVHECTRHSVCIDAEELVLYYRCRENSQICVVDPRRTDVDGTETVSFGMISVPQFLHQNRGGVT
ncbi:MAG: linear amide C-N hydrolase [archaeon]|nr:linear amide C-N hydrolase [archaeon]